MKKLFIVLIALSIWSCKKADSSGNYSVDTTGESGQQVGDAMASVDESGGNTNGAIASLEVQSYERAFARLANRDISTTQAALLRLFPQAQAASCNAVAFASCNANQKIRTLDGCTTFGGGVMSGNVTLNFSGTGAASCTIPMAADAVTRVPNFSLTGLRGATFSVSGSGQTLTRVGATSFSFANAGVRRSFVTPKGDTILDISTSTTSPISVTGNSRSTRTISGGALNVVNNLSGVSCSISPSSVSWTSSCNCPTSGSWSGSCSDSTSLSVAFSSTCGQATVTKGTEVSTITMDRCN